MQVFVLHIDKINYREVAIGCILCLLFYVQLEDILLVWKRHHCWWMVDSACHSLVANRQLYAGIWFWFRIWTKFMLRANLRLSVYKIVSTLTSARMEALRLVITIFRRFYIWYLLTESLYFVVDFISISPLQMHGHCQNRSRIIQNVNT